MAGSFPGIVRQKGTYYARIVVPKDVRHLFESGELWQTLKASSLADAKRAAPPILAGFRRRIAEARRGVMQDDRTQPARIALANWAVTHGRTPAEEADPATHTPWQVQARVEALRRAWRDPDGWKDIPDFDTSLVDALAKGGLRVAVDDPTIPMMRREAALTFMYATRAQERDRLSEALRSRAEAVAGADLDEIPAAPALADPAPPAPSLTIRQLFDRWVTTVKPVEKERGRLNHQIRRLVEAVGDKPANWLTRTEIEEFMGLVARFPGRKRPPSLNSLPIRELVQKFEADNAVRRTKSEAGVAEGRERPEEPWRTLTKTTAGEWFASYHRMFRYGVLLGLIETNPFEGLKFTATGGESIRRRGYTDAEMTRIFTAPLFQGFSRQAGSQRLRNEPGTEIAKDAKYWLPILSLFHGTRLTELAAMRLRDFKTTDGGVHYFDLTERQVKTPTSKRLVPLHPHLAEIGFLEYVEGLSHRGVEWLFPDLDHASKIGPGHEFSKFWGDWCDDIGLADRSITHHSWRHTWKRRARSSEVKEEMHDVISGHKSMSVGRGYGAGADIEPLARAMALITFPAFPALPLG